MSTKKIPLLYVGPGYTMFTQSQCNQLVSQSGATEFLLTTAYAFNYCREGDPILTQYYFDNNIHVSYYGTTDPDQVSEIETDMTEALDAATNLYGNQTDVWNYTVYVNNAITVALRLINANSSCKVWFGLPPMLGSCTAAAMCYNYYYEEYIINAVRTQMTNAGKWSNVEGFYYGQENIPQWYTAFNTMAVANNFNNVVVNNMVYIASVVHGMNKKIMWIPYYRDDGSLIMERVGNVINKKDIFDYAILQPSYYFVSSLGTAAVTLVKNCIAQQKCVSSTGSIIGGSKTSSTEIGGEMEIDLNAKTNSSYLNRYNTYVSNFATYITGTTKRPIAFYADYPEVLMDSMIFGKVKNFFTSGT